MGRLFDCVAALCGFQTKITYDAQAAIELESLIHTKFHAVYNYRIHDTKNGYVLGYKDTLTDILDDIRNQLPRSFISSKFHNTVIEATAECVCKIRQKTRLEDVVLSGGVFENAYLLERLVWKLRNLSFNVYYNQLTPANDGGISFGQAAAASAFLKENGYVSCNSGQSNANQPRSCRG